MNIQKALDLAYKAHHGQKTWSGNPYIFHPIRLMERMDTEEEKCVALLHDVVEDADVTLDCLNSLFPYDESRIYGAVKALTHIPDVPYHDYIGRLSSSDMAVKVKIADLKDNMRIERIPHLSQLDFKRLHKYKKALDFLLKV